jgi:hypothetical protein
VQSDNKIPKSQIFRFEEFWIEFDEFMEVVEKAWNSGTFFSNSSKDLVARFKVARKELKF